MLKWFHRSKNKTKSKKKNKRQKLTREQKKIIKKRRKRTNKSHDHFQGQKDFFSDHGYVDYDDYVKV